MLKYIGSILLSLISHQLISAMDIEADSLKTDNSKVELRQFEDLKSKYSEDIFVYERALESSGWWTRFKQWLNDFIKDLFNLENRQQAERVTDLIVEIGGVILFLLVIYFIVRAYLNKEGQWVFGKSSDKSIIPVTDIESNLQVVDFERMIDQAENQNEFRLAIRYYYLWLLKKLSKADLIEYDQEKTNLDYQNEIRSQKLKSDFSYTSYLYNYIWYGHFDVTRGQFKQARRAFDKLLKSLGS